VQDARRSSDDLTEAEKWAWMVAQKRAATECDGYLSKLNEIHGEELFSLAQLCMLGNNPQATRESIRHYLASPNPASRKQAILLLARAEVKLNTITEAVHHSEQLLDEFGYDTDSDDLVSYVIDGAQAREVTLSLAIALSERRMPLLLSAIDRLGSSAAPQDDSKFSLSQLFDEGLTMCELYRQTGQNQEAQTCAQKMNRLSDDSRWKDIYDLKLMKNALTRFHSVGSPTTARRINSSVLLPDGRTREATIPLQSGRVVLFVFSLASPASVRSWSDLHSILRSAPDHPAKVYAVTTYQLNGAEDSVVKQAVIQGLKQLRSHLLPPPLIHIVPDRELQAFGLDSYPSIVAISEGQIIFSAPFHSSPGTAGRFTRALAPKNQP
jgi:hypothetical protein